MRCAIFLASMLFSITVMGQDEQIHYTVFNPKKLPKEYFISTNSGVLNTQVGLKIGVISHPGYYLGFRHGLGKIYNSDSNLMTEGTHLYSITYGINRPLIIHNDFKLIGQFGLGLGHWWRYRWEGWTKSGIEVETGLMIQKKNFLFNITGNFLWGRRTYPTGDVAVGIGYTLKKCD